METYPNVYYNYRKHRRAKEVARKQDILHQIQTIYHETNDVAGYRRMRIYLARNGIELSTLTVHKYMNTELGCAPLCGEKPRNIKAVRSIRSLRICSSKILQHHKSIKNGQQISPIYFSMEAMSDITVRLLICMTAALSQA